MGFLDFIFDSFSIKPNNNKNTQTKKAKQKEDDFDWETMCENCGELLEDCECDDKPLSLEDICIMDDDDEEDEKEENSLDFLDSNDDDDDDDGSDDFESF